jgi:putative PEP-CTERM system TPR-repeat lipoprotein
LAVELPENRPNSGNQGIPMEIRKLWACTAVLLTVLAAGCSRSPQSREARYLQRGKDLLAKKDAPRALLEFRSAIAARPKSAEPYYQLGLAYLALKDSRSAAAAFQKSVQLNQAHTGAQLKLAEIMGNTRNVGRLRDAMSRLQSVIAGSPDNTEAMDALAITEWRLGQVDSAEKLLEEALHKFPANLESSIMLARIKLGQRDFEGAESALKTAAERAPHAAPPELALGELYIILNRAQQAENAFQKALQLDSQNGPAMLGVAAVRLAEGHADLAEQTLRKAAALPDHRYHPLYAVFLYRSGKRQEALAEFRKIAEQHPGDRRARTRLVEAYLQMNKLAEAQGVLQAALKKNPKDVDALFQRGELDLRIGKTEEAQHDLSEVIHWVPDSAPARVALAVAYKASGQEGRERQELGEALRFDPGLLAARLELANNLLHTNDPRAALHVLEEASNSQKQTLAWMVARNRIWLALHKLRELRAAIDAALTSGRPVELVLQDGLLKLAERDYASAIAAAEEVLTRNPEDATAARVIVDSYVFQKRPEMAGQKLAALTAAHPGSAPLEYLLGEWQLKTGNQAAARKAWESAKTADSRFFQADLALAELDRRENHTEKARQRLDSVLAADPKNVAAMLQSAHLYEEQGNDAEAIRFYRSVLTVERSNFVALNNLAYHLVPINSDEALSLAQQAAESAPNEPAVQDTLGWALYRKGIYTTAMGHLKAAFDKDPTPQRQFHLAMLYLKVGQKSEGQKMLAGALQRDPNLARTEQGW